MNFNQNIYVLNECRNVCFDYVALLQQPQYNVTQAVVPAYKQEMTTQSYWFYSKGNFLFWRVVLRLENFNLENQAVCVDVWFQNTAPVWRPCAAGTVTGELMLLSYRHHSRQLYVAYSYCLNYPDCQYKSQLLIVSDTTLSLGFICRETVIC